MMIQDYLPEEIQPYPVNPPLQNLSRKQQHSESNLSIPEIFDQDRALCWLSSLWGCWWLLPLHCSSRGSLVFFVHFWGVYWAGCLLQSWFLQQCAPMVLDLVELEWCFHWLVYWLACIHELLLLLRLQCQLVADSSSHLQQTVQDQSCCGQLLHLTSWSKKSPLQNPFVLGAPKIKTVTISWGNQ